MMHVMKHVLPLLFIAAGLLVARSLAAQAIEAADKPMPSLQNIQPADTPTMLPANDGAPYPAAEFLDERRPPEPRSFKRGMLKRQYRWLPEHETTQAAPATPPEPTGLPPEANPPRDVQGAPLHGPDDSTSPRDIQRARPDLRDRERPNGLGRFSEPPPANPSGSN
jgi:hypothetical protein